MGAVVDPFAGGGNSLAGGNGCGMANHGHDVTMSAHFGTKNAKTILCVVVSDAFDKARQHFLIGYFRLRLHISRALYPAGLWRMAFSASSSVPAS